MAISLGVYAVFSQIQPNSTVSTPASFTGLFLPVLLIAHGMASGLPAVVVVEIFNVKVFIIYILDVFKQRQVDLFLSYRMQLPGY